MTSLEKVANRGERIVETEHPRVVRAHLDRYRFAARRLPPGARVLDCASGSGYGTSRLAKRFGRVEGVDVSPEGVAFASEHYRAANLRFTVGSALELPFADATFDAYTSFETIEHVPDPDRLLVEALRVLKPGGTLLLSTPNRLCSGLASGETPSNPFHLFEWSFRELHQHLAKRFSGITYYGQRIRSRNKLEPSYFRSKVQRWLRVPDFVPLPVSEDRLKAMEGWSTWQPENFVAVCRKMG